MVCNNPNDANKEDSSVIEVAHTMLKLKNLIRVHGCKLHDWRATKSKTTKYVYNKNTHKGIRTSKIKRTR